MTSTEKRLLFFPTTRTANRKRCLEKNKAYLSNSYTFFLFSTTLAANRKRDLKFFPAHVWLIKKSLYLVYNWLSVFAIYVTDSMYMLFNTSIRNDMYMLLLLLLLLLFTLNRSFYPTTSAVARVSFLILHPRDIQIMWSEKNQTLKNQGRQTKC